MKLLFMGRKKVAAQCLTALLKRRDCEVVGVLTDSHLSVSPTSEVARSHGIPLFDFGSALIAMQVGTLKFDLGLSMLYWRKLRQEFLTIPRYGVINFHPAPLPEYKGVGGYNLAVMHGLKEWAVTAHFVDASIDTGPIIFRSVFPLDPDVETARTIESRSQTELETLFNDTLRIFFSDPDKVPTVKNGQGIYLSRMQLEEMKRVDLDRDDVDRKVRAFWFPPYDGAFVEVAGVRYTLVNRQILNEVADESASSLFSSPVGRKVS